MGNLEDKVQRVIKYMRKQKLDCMILTETKVLLYRAEKKRQLHQIVSKIGHLHLNSFTI